jgi:hypothetical protein
MKISLHSALERKVMAIFSLDTSWHSDGSFRRNPECMQVAEQALVYTTQNPARLIADISEITIRE